MNNFKALDIVICTCVPTHAMLTLAKQYVITNVNRAYVYVVDDSGIPCCCLHNHFLSAAAYTRSNNPSRFYASTPTKQTVTDTEEEDYTASKRAVSLGKFKKGDRLVYKDHTPINLNGGAFIVHTCTATMLLFEHGYSWPFSPEEFKLEGTY